ncbi:MAG: hypothetical protein CFE21_01340 [Bacteroidetes bacterium B1(2017)]|nr:MAG: hypothetical protein CFE21_01340 [Bacteroidetes bacterium B1(2017)]
MKTNFSHGATFEGTSSYLGILTFGVGLFYLFGLNLFLPAIGLCFVGAVLFIQVKGISIDTERNRFKPYLHLLFYRIGFWYSLDEIKEITLRYFNESQNIYPRHIAVYTATARCYEIHFVAKDGELYLIQDIKSHSAALDFCKELSEKTGLPFKDLAPGHKNVS